MIYTINFADASYQKQQSMNTITAKLFGKCDRAIQYSPLDINLDFRDKHSNIFKHKRGAGLWLWKPYIIYDCLQKINAGDYLVYCDSGAIFIGNIRYLISSLEKTNQSVMGFLLPLLERQFTKKETFVEMDYMDYDNNQILATFIVIRKDEFSVSFIKEWLDICCNEKAISPTVFDKEIGEFTDFIVHREDQSIFSILYHKHNLLPFKDPSQFGERPWQYKWHPSFSSWSSPWLYQFNNKPIGDYKKLLISYRTRNLWMILVKEFIKEILLKLGYYKLNL